MRKFLRKTVYLFIGSYIMLWVSACSGDDIKKFAGMQVDDSRSVIVLVDFSSAQHFPERSSYYGGIIGKEMIENLGMHDRLVVLPIDRASLSNSEEIFLADLSKENFASTSGPIPEREKQTRQNFEKRKKDLLADFQSRYDAVVKSRAPLSAETDIFGALASVKRYSVPNRPVLLVMLSDMMHHTKNLSMEPGKAMSKEKLDTILKTVQKVDLGGHQVFVLTGDQTPNQSGHFETIQLFWTKYFAENGATLIDYSSAARSKLVAAMQSNS